MNYVEEPELPSRFIEPVYIQGLIFFAASPMVTAMRPSSPFTGWEICIAGALNKFCHFGNYRTPYIVPERSKAAWRNGHYRH